MFIVELKNFWLTLVVTFLLNGGLNQVTFLTCFLFETDKVGQKVLKLIDRHFPVGSKIRKVFNRNMVKVSYSCMPSMGSIIKQHNAHICGPEQESGSQPRCCNCRKPERCPLNRHCLNNKIVYTVEPPITDPLASWQFLYNGHWLWHWLNLLWN